MRSLYSLFNTSPKTFPVINFFTWQGLQVIHRPGWKLSPFSTRTGYCRLLQMFLIALSISVFSSSCVKKDLTEEGTVQEMDDAVADAPQVLASSVMNSSTELQAPVYKMTKRSDHVTDFNRDGSRSVQIGEWFYSLGGWAVPEESYHDVYRSNGNLSTWKKRPDAPWHGRHVYGLAKIDSTVYVLGGDNLHSVFDIWSTMDGTKWKLLASNKLGNRIYYGACAHNGFLYVVGGSGYKDVWRSPNGKNWTRIAKNISFLKGENFAGSLISFNGKMWMVDGGGSGGGTGTPRKTVYSSVDGITWQREHNFGGVARYYTDMCVWDNKLWVVGGYNEAMYPLSNLSDIWNMTTDGIWHKFTGVPAAFIGRHATGVGVYNNSLVITCGNYNNDCWAIEKN